MQRPKLLNGLRSFFELSGILNLLFYLLSVVGNLTYKLQSTYLEIHHLDDDLPASPNLIRGSRATGRSAPTEQNLVNVSSVDVHHASCLFSSFCRKKMTITAKKVLNNC